MAAMESAAMAAPIVRTVRVGAGTALLMRRSS